MLTELIAALPSGAAEALVGHGLADVTRRIRERKGSDSNLALELDMLSDGDLPARPLERIAADLTSFLAGEFGLEISDSTIKQKAGSHSTMMAAGRDLIVPPRMPDQ